VSVFERVKELDYLTKMYNEIAVQTRPRSRWPSGGSGAWKETSDKEMADTLDKALKQLSKVEMTYRRWPSTTSKKGSSLHRDASQHLGSRRLCVV